LCELKETLQGFFITKKMNGYDLSRQWFNFRYENRDKVRAIHSELYFYIVDLWNRLGQKDSFGLPTNVTMECLGVGSYSTFKNALQDLVDFGFVKIVKESKNQHYSRIIALTKSDKATVKALDKATIKASDEAGDKPTDTIIKQGTRNKEQVTIPMSGKPDGDVAQTSKDNVITTITEKWITYINSIFAKKYTLASWSKKIEPNIKKLLKAYGDKSKLSDNFKIVTKNILQDTFHLENNYRYVTPEYVSRLAVFDRFLNIEASQNNGRWRHPSDIVMCSDWIKKIPQPPNPLDVEACEQFCTDWKIAQLRTYQYEKTGYTNMIHDYEP
jgi:hypothetical protein